MHTIRTSSGKVPTRSNFPFPNKPTLTIGYKKEIMDKTAVSPPQPGQSVREKTYWLLRKQLLTGQFRPNQRLTEEALANRLGVSRTPVREALHKLELEGLVSSAGARGFRVPEDSLEEMNELFEIRSILEGHALAVLCQLAGREDIDELRAIVGEAEEASRQHQPERVLALNTRFHDRLYSLLATGRPRLHALIEDMRQYVLRYRENTLLQRSGAERSVAGHRKILLALELGEPELCERIMRAHVREAREDTPEPQR